MKKKLNNWLKTNNKTEISAPFDKNGNYDVHGKYEWYYFPYENDEGDVGAVTTEMNDIVFPGEENIIKGIVKHNNIFGII